MKISTMSDWFRLAEMLQGDVQVWPLENSTFAPRGTVSTVTSCSVPRMTVAHPARNIRDMAANVLRMDPAPAHGKRRSGTKVASSASGRDLSLADSAEYFATANRGLMDTENDAAFNSDHLDGFACA